ncbi:hypothetical protein RB195_026210 [Necator americanus]|uniref:Uncharacterized protein n=1 Tax=Necator americanus TaxID=51031 RepID=A0ABR1EVW9_NECAM
MRKTDIVVNCAMDSHVPDGLLERMRTRESSKIQIREGVARSGVNRVDIGVQPHYSHQVDRLTPDPHIHGLYTERDRSLYDFPNRVTVPYTRLVQRVFCREMEHLNPL